MGLYKRGEIWWMSFIYQGKQVRRSTETDDRKLAQRIFDKIKGEIAEGKWFERLPGQDLTFKDMADKYLNEYSARNKSARSHTRDKSLIKHLLDHFETRPLLEIRAKEIAAYKETRRGQGASPRTVNYELTLMGHMFNIAAREWEWVRENPARRVSKEKVRNTLERWLTIQEETRLLAKSPPWLRDIVIFAVNTGFRESEILDLKWKQIDFDRATITISEQKNGEIDTLPLCRTVLDLLERKAKDPHGQNDLVFPSANGTRMIHRNLFRAYKSALEKAGLMHVRFHDLRHTFATRLVQSGVDLYTVQKLGRWKTVSMVMRYAHHYPESLRPGIEVMDRLKGGAITNVSQSQKIRGHKSSLRLVTPCI